MDRRFQEVLSAIDALRSGLDTSDARVDSWARWVVMLLVQLVSGLLNLVDRLKLMKGCGTTGPSEWSR